MKHKAFSKLQQILGSILPVDEILTVETTEYATKMEQFLRHDFILALVDLRPAAIIKKFELRKPIYKQLAAYGHMGREDLGVKWEDRDLSEKLEKILL